MISQLVEQLDIYSDSKSKIISAVMGRNRRLSGESAPIRVTTPIDGSEIALFNMASKNQTEQVITNAVDAFISLRAIPAPKRGEFIREVGSSFRKHKQKLAELITLECGKILQESLGEVQEVIDICDFAVGLSRQLHGLTIVSERPNHRMMEQWHPLGPVAVISAFNFPMAVWAWNAMLAIVCGDSVIWKPSEKTPLCALACQSLIEETLKQFPELPDALSQVVIGDYSVGELLTRDARIPLVSATGSVPMGRKVATTVAQRLGRSLLELGGNNGMIVSPSADIELALRAIVFSAVGTCGQRCTTLRRLIVHESIADELLSRLVKTYAGLPIGDPTNPKTLIGPLIDQQAYELMQVAIDQAREAGGTVFYGGEQITLQGKEGGFYVAPTLIEIGGTAEVVKRETFAPILYLIRYSDFAEAVKIHNSVPQGLSSAVFTNDLRESEFFLSAAGSDCGLANVNIGTSGAEIGGAFGGEKETGGGRESGSDAWKNYMRRTTNTINYGHDIPLAQGIKFD